MQESPLDSKGGQEARGHCRAQDLVELASESGRDAIGNSDT